jgi:23S rRNA (cytidine1920-2'-O)/16S rRNA (cytidine1409-2'-O)-methyltransferase
MGKCRLDQLLVDRGLLAALAEAQSYVIQGHVLVDDHKQFKPGTSVSDTAVLRLLKKPSLYVSRGGDKLAGAITAFKLKFEDAIVLDVGISTGGFTDCALQHGARHVIGIDVGYGQVANSISVSPQVTLIERCNARTLTPASFEGLLQKHQAPHAIASDISFVVMDVSFISICKVLPAIQALVPAHTLFVILIKPQFESQKSEIPDGGVITDLEVLARIKQRTQDQIKDLGFTIIQDCLSPLKGAKGNQEFFFLLRFIK